MKKLILSTALLFGSIALCNAQTKAPPDIEKLLQKNMCLACHKVDTKLVGPSYKDVMAQKKYKPKQIVDLIYKPNPKNWPGFPAMAALPNVPKDEALKIAQWMVTLK